MKNASLIAAGATILVANAFALVHAAMNRSGPVDSEITLTEKELTLAYNSDDEDSGVAMTIVWTDPHNSCYGPEMAPPWLDQKVLADLGFDTSVAPTAKNATDFYTRQRARRGFVALEYNGPAWKNWLDDCARQEELQRQKTGTAPPANPRANSTRLVAIDAGRDSKVLRGRHPDRGSVIIVPAAIRISVDLRGAQQPELLNGYIQEIPRSIHVPLPFSAQFRPMGKIYPRPPYSVHLRYGSSREPWIVGAEAAEVRH